MKNKILYDGKEITEIEAIDIVTRDKRSYFMLHYIKGQTFDICLNAVRNNGLALEYVENKTEEICIEAVRNNGLALKFVEEQNDNICMIAINNNWEALKYVKNKTLDLCLFAVKNDGLALEYVENQTLEICIKAMENNISSFKYAKYQTDDMCLRAVNYDGCNLKFVKNQTPEICLTAVKENSYAFIYSKIQNKEICVEALKGAEYILVDRSNKRTEWIRKNVYILEHMNENLIQSLAKEGVLDYKKVSDYDKHKNIFACRINFSSSKYFKTFDIQSRDCIVEYTSTCKGTIADTHVNNAEMDEWIFFVDNKALNEDEFLTILAD